VAFATAIVEVLPNLRDARALAPVVAPYRAAGYTPSQVIDLALSDLPPRIGSPPGFVASRLADHLRGPGPLAMAEAARRRRDQQLAEFTALESVAVPMPPDVRQQVAALRRRPA
jgi:hypothetical protein